MIYHFENHFKPGKRANVNDFYSWAGRMLDFEARGEKSNYDDSLKIL